MEKITFRECQRSARSTHPQQKIEIDKVESLLNVTLPQELREIMLETNGVKGNYDLGIIWLLDRIINENRHDRDGFIEEYYMPFEKLVFFAESGIGDLFAFPVAQDGVCRDDVFVWNHENDRRMWVAPSVT